MDLLLWWVDDDLSGFTKDDDNCVQHCVDEIGSHLPIEDKGVPSSYLGMSFCFNPTKGISYMYQPGLIEKIVQITGMHDSKGSETPLKCLRCQSIIIEALLIKVFIMCHMRQSWVQSVISRIVLVRIWQTLIVCWQRIR